MVWFMTALPRHVMFYDVVEFAYSHRMSPALCRELPKLLAPPVNQHVHMEHIRILSQYRYCTNLVADSLRGQPSHTPY